MTTPQAKTDAEPPAESRIQPARFEFSKPMLVAGLRGHFTTAPWDGIPAQWKRLMAFGDIPGKISSVYYGMCFQQPAGIDLSGYQVANLAGLPFDFTHVEMPAQKYAVFEHLGHVEKLHSTIENIWHHWSPAPGHEVAKQPPTLPDFFERYGEKFDPRTLTGDIEVWIPVRG